MPESPSFRDFVERRRTPSPIAGQALPDGLPSTIRTHTARLATTALVVLAALGALHFTKPLPQLEEGPFAGFLARPSLTAFGESGELKLKFSLPGGTVSYPLDVKGDPAQLSYGWTHLADTAFATPLRPLVGANVAAPMIPGFYRLVLVRSGVRRFVDGLTLAVMVPFKEKEGGLLRGYRIGTYLAERIAGKQPPPEGFLEVTPTDVDIPITKHLRVGDFLNHDDQDVWPRYAAVNPRVADKLELVLAEIARWHGSSDSARINLTIDVHSGFRAPDHNRHVQRAASDSQHQYGDAADVAIDVDGDGKFTSQDARMVALAVEIVELKHPGLVGGMGLYLSRRTGPYVHIDARGRRVRWRG
jgi:hypothetical protein